MRETIFSVTNFLYYNDQYLMLLRKKDAVVDANKLNGIGGKLNNGENFLQAAMRETKEETGYSVDVHQIHFSGLVTLKGGYPQDWVMGFFTIAIDSPVIPLGPSVAEGKLLWMPKNTVLTSEYTLVDDLYYLWEDIISHKTFFAATEVDEHEKIKSIHKTYLAVT